MKLHFTLKEIRSLIIKYKHIHTCKTTKKKPIKITNPSRQYSKNQRLQWYHPPAEATAGKFPSMHSVIWLAAACLFKWWNKLNGVLLFLFFFSLWQLPEIILTGGDLILGIWLESWIRIELKIIHDWNYEWMNEWIFLGRSDSQSSKLGHVLFWPPRGLCLNWIVKMAIHQPHISLIL